MSKYFSRPRAHGVGLTSHVPPEAVEQRSKPVRNRVRPESTKAKASKPRVHRVGRSKR